MAGVARRVSSCECRQTSRRPACSPRSTRGKVSSVAARAKLTPALEFVREGDVLVVTKPDRLARSTRNLLDIVEDLERRGIALVVLSMGGQRIDTRSPTGKLMLTMLGAIATFERDLMLERQREANRAWAA